MHAPADEPARREQGSATVASCAWLRGAPSIAVHRGWQRLNSEAWLCLPWAPTLRSGGTKQDDGCPGIRLPPLSTRLRSTEATYDDDDAEIGGYAGALARAADHAGFAIGLVLLL